MSTRRAFMVSASTALLTVATTAPAQAKASFLINPRPPFEDLLPNDFALTDAPPADPASLRDKKVAVIPTQNLNRYAQGWLDWYDNGGAQRNWAVQLFGLTHDYLAADQRISDPRRLTDQIIDLIRPYFADVVVAQDFPSAREQGADYFLVLDCAMSLRNMNGRFRADGGVYLLDASLHRVFQTTGFGEASRGFLVNPLTRDPIAMDEAMTAMMSQVTDGVRAHFGASQ